MGSLTHRNGELTHSYVSLTGYRVDLVLRVSSYSYAWESSFLKKGKHVTAFPRNRGALTRPPPPEHRSAATWALLLLQQASRTSRARPSTSTAGCLDRPSFGAIVDQTVYYTRLACTRMPYLEPFCSWTMLVEEACCSRLVVHTRGQSLVLFYYTHRQTDTDRQAYLEKRAPLSRGRPCAGHVVGSAFRGRVLYFLYGPPHMSKHARCPGKRRANPPTASMRN